MKKTSEESIEREIEQMRAEWAERREFRDREAIQRLKERFDYAVNVVCMEGRP